MHDIVCCKCGNPKHCSEFKIEGSRYYPICKACCHAWVLKGNTPLKNKKGKHGK